MLEIKDLFGSPMTVPYRLWYSQVYSATRSSPTALARDAFLGITAESTAGRLDCADRIFVCYGTRQHLPEQQAAACAPSNKWGLQA